MTALCVAGFLAPFAGAAGASAKVLESDAGSYSFEESVSDFCDFGGLTIDVAGTIDFRCRLVSRGKDQLPFFMEVRAGTVTFTNQAGDCVTEESRVLEKDLTVVDNGDGTFTILVLATGGARIVDSDGKVIGSNPGQVRYEILVDNGSTPTDPRDDEFLKLLDEVKGSTGRNDDFCDTVVGALG